MDVGAAEVGGKDPYETETDSEEFVSESNVSKVVVMNGIGTNRLDFGVVNRLDANGGQDVMMVDNDDEGLSTETDEYASDEDRRHQHQHQGTPQFPAATSPHSSPSTITTDSTVSATTEMMATAVVAAPQLQRGLWPVENQPMGTRTGLINDPTLPMPVYGLFGTVDTEETETETETDEEMSVITPIPPPSNPNDKTSTSTTARILPISDPTKPSFLTVLDHTTDHIIMPAFSMMSKGIDGILKSRAQDLLNHVVVTERSSVRIAMDGAVEMVRNQVLSGFSADFMKTLASKYRSAALQYEVVASPVEGARFGEGISRQFQSICDQDLNDWLEQASTRLASKIRALIGMKDSLTKEAVSYWPEELWGPIEKQIRGVFAGGDMAPFVAGVSEVLSWTA
ncbi:hypothetical protein HK102_013189 [Quaeritorhiza haematococci]|nr:hypothetical protein HK102_013189 [Quaeritorhiza haematococci]